MNNIMKFIMPAAMAAGMAAIAQAAEVNDVKARQRWPWNGLVDIDCTVSGINGTDYGSAYVKKVGDWEATIE